MMYSHKKNWIRYIQGCGVGRFFRIPTPDSYSSSFEKPTPTPAVLKNRLRLQHFLKPDSDSSNLKKTTPTPDSDSSRKHATPPTPTPQP